MLPNGTLLSSRGGPYKVSVVLKVRDACFIQTLMCVKRLCFSRLLSHTYPPPLIPHAKGCWGAGDECRASAGDWSGRYLCSSGYLLHGPTLSPHSLDSNGAFGACKCLYSPQEILKGKLH